MNRKDCLTFERLAESVLVEAFGAPDRFTGRDVWEFDFGGRGIVRVTLYRDSVLLGRQRRESWLACQWRWEGRRGPDGYALPKDDVPGGWPAGFSYPVGKLNFFPDRHIEYWRAQIIDHLRRITAPGSVERRRVEHMIT